MFYFEPRIHHGALNIHSVCVSFILSSRKSHQEIPNMDKSVLLLLYENMETLNIRLWQYMVYLCFSSHLRVINKVYEQCSANWHSIYYNIETILPYYVIKTYINK